MCIYITKNWLLCLRRLASPNLQRGLAGLRPGRAGDAVPVQRPTGRDLGEPVVQLKPKNSVFLREASLFVLFRLSTDWTRPTHVIESSLLTQSPLI